MFKIRDAEASDAQFVFELSNDPAVRANSLHPAPIAWDEHVAWFARRLADPDTLFYVVEAAGTPAGQIRFQRGKEGWIASMSMAAEFRGKGNASGLCRAAMRRSGLKDVLAWTRTLNAAALGVLRANGFRDVKTETVEGVEYRVLRFVDDTWIVAEMSANHRGDLARAKALVKAAKAAGADAVKLQTYTADTMTLACNRPPFVVSGGTLWDGKTLHDVYQAAMTPWEWVPELKAFADSIGIELFSTPFDPSAVDFLEEVGVHHYKIASFEAVDIPLVRRAAATGKPVLISTGICTLDEMQEAVAACHAEGNLDVTLLKCTSSYPAALSSLHVATVRDMVEKFSSQGVRIGLSDHSLSPVPSVVAVALGARVIEKHLTLDRPEGDAESSFALLPEEFSRTVRAIRNAEESLGEVSYAVDETARNYRRSIFVAEDVAKGERFSRRNVRSVRPAGGLEPKFLPEILGRCAARDIQRGEPLDWQMVEKGLT